MFFEFVSLFAFSFQLQLTLKLR